MHPCLLKREQSVSWHDLVATALESATRVFEHGEQRLMQLQLEMQDARRRSLETAGCQTRIDQPSNRNAGLIDDAEEEAELLAGVTRRHGEQNPFVGAMLAQQRFRLRVCNVCRRLRQRRRPRERRSAQRPPIVGLRKQWSEPKPSCSLFAGERPVLLQQRNTR